MAEICLKNSMEFFYIEKGFVSKLLDELENRYKYQKILFVGADECVTNEILSQKQRQLFCVFENDFNISISDIALVVCFDKKLIFECKNYCYVNKINYVLALNSFVSVDMFCAHNGTNQLLGVIVDSNSIQKNFTNFVYDFAIDCAYFYFYLTENKINQLYFCDEKSENLSQKYEKIKEIIEFFNNNCDFKENFEKILDYYFDLIMLFYNQTSCYISKFFLPNCGYSNIVTMELISNIYLLFLFKGTPLRVKSASGVVDSNFLCKFDEKKFWFVNDKFKPDVINALNGTLDELNKIKLICARLDKERMFVEASNMNLVNFQKQIFDISSSIKENSFIKIINYFGMLNF